MQSIGLLGEETIKSVAFAEHHIVLQKTVVADQWVDAARQSPVGLRLVVTADQLMPVDHRVTFGDAAEQAVGGGGGALSSPPPQAAANRAAARAVSRAMRTGCKVLKVFMDAIF